RSISQWSRATGPANLLRFGRPTRRNMTAMMSIKVADCAINRMSAAHVFGITANQANECR
ncbi:MAG: hypothetical protein ACKVHE_28800, partial [Planctomycetales bacterium]